MLLGSQFMIKKLTFALTLSASVFAGSYAFAEEAATEQDPPSTTNICALKGVPPSDFKYKVVKKLKLGKGSYGSVTDIQPKFAQLALNVGADALIYYNGSQRFGFFPWRMVRPVITGTAIKWDKGNKQSFACTANGGILL